MTTEFVGSFVGRRLGEQQHGRRGSSWKSAVWVQRRRGDVRCSARRRVGAAQGDAAARRQVGAARMCEARRQVGAAQGDAAARRRGDDARGLARWRGDVRCKYAAVLRRAVAWLG